MKLSEINKRLQETDLITKGGLAIVKFVDGQRSTADKVTNLFMQGKETPNVHYTAIRHKSDYISERDLFTNVRENSVKYGLVTIIQKPLDPNSLPSNPEEYFNLNYTRQVADITADVTLFVYQDEEKTRIFIDKFRSSELADTLGIIGETIVIEDE